MWEKRKGMWMAADGEIETKGGMEQQLETVNAMERAAGGNLTGVR